MNKIICEICGTVYPDSASQCPICGYPRNLGDNGETPEAEAAEVAGSSYQRVRGGRFSNRNVKKRNKAAQAEEHSRGHRKSTEELDEPEQTERLDNRGLVITVVVLLVAVIFVGAYIGLRFFRGADAYDKATEDTAAGTVATEPSETDPAETAVACTDLEIADISLSEGVEFLGKGRAWRLNVTTVPANTTDEILVTSSDKSVVSVDMSGEWIELLSEAPGEVTITVQCGAVTKQFPVVCNFEEETEATGESTDATDATEATEAATEATQETQDSNWTLNYTDASIGIGFSFDLKLTNDAGEVAAVNWTTSSDDISINGNTITGKSLNDYIEVTGTYNGQTYMCIVRVRDF